MSKKTQEPSKPLTSFLKASVLAVTKPFRVHFGRAIALKAEQPDLEVIVVAANDKELEKFWALWEKMRGIPLSQRSLLNPKHIHPVVLTHQGNVEMEDDEL